MKSIFVFAVLAALALGAQSAPSPCESCKSVSNYIQRTKCYYYKVNKFQMVQNFIDASKDRMKMAQLKVSLSMLCVGTSHQSDCSKTLDKLDFIAYKLAPYLVGLRHFFREYSEFSGWHLRCMLKAPNVRWISILTTCSSCHALLEEIRGHRS